MTQFSPRKMLRPKWLLVIALFLLTAWSNFKLTTAAPPVSRPADFRAEVMYLPTGKSLELISFGYRNTLANVLWFNAVDYFGRHYRSDQEYRWLDHMCDLVTTLDPRVSDIYYFCATMIAWEMKRPERTIELLSRAIKAHPDDWFFFYLRGFYYYLFLHDRERAKQDFIASAKRPNAHPIVARLAAKKLAEHDTATAIAFLKDMIAKAKDPLQREALEGRLREVIAERDIQYLERLQILFESKYGHKATVLQDLASVTSHPLPQRDPYGGEYRIDPQTQSIVSSTGRKRLKDIGRKGESQ